MNTILDILHSLVTSPLARLLFAAGAGMALCLWLIWSFAATALGAL